MIRFINNVFDLTIKNPIYINILIAIGLIIVGVLFTILSKKIKNKRKMILLRIGLGVGLIAVVVVGCISDVSNARNGDYIATGKIVAQSKIQMMKQPITVDLKEICETLEPDEVADADVEETETIVSELNTDETSVDTDFLNTSGQLFDDNTEGKYNYCPSSFVKDGVIYTFYCSNESSYKVKDCIKLTKSKKNTDGTYSYSDAITVLSASDSGWDSVHVCDPSVVEGDFTYKNQKYQYIMAYLGCNTTDNQYNKIGVAVSNNLVEWTKVSELNPIIDFSANSNYISTFQWGVGQPSLINLDKAGKIALFYTSGTYNLTSEKLDVWDLSSLDSPYQVEETITITNNGRTMTNGSQDFVSNADFMIDGNTLYMVADTHPFSGNALSIVADTSTVSTIDIDSASISTTINNSSWQTYYSISSKVTGFDKNHNCAFIRDSYGYKNSGNVEVLYTGAWDSSDFSTALWSYRIYKLGL